jgi:uncharacterized protein (TIGR00661 family)
MRVLYAIQGTGNGHISRALEILPALKKRVEVDVLISGMHSELSLPCEVNYRLNGLGFKFGKRGGVDYFSTWRHGNFKGFIREIHNLDLSSYDLVINDFEPVSAWAARRQHVPCVGLSNQAAIFFHENTHIKDFQSNLSRRLFKHYAPVDAAYGFSYTSSPPFISTPVIRKSIRESFRQRKDYYLVYLPFYKDSKIIRALSRYKSVKWKLFSKHSNKPFEQLNVKVYPISESHFNYALTACKGVLCGAGFGTTTEALFLGKKLMVIPMKNQYEQLCNAEILRSFGIPVIKALKRKWRGEISQWLENDFSVEFQYPDRVQQVVDGILSDFADQHALFAMVQQNKIAQMKS